MKRIILFSIFLSCISLEISAQSTDSLKFITIRPTASVLNYDWFEKNTVGEIGLQLKIQASPKANITFGTGLFKSFSTSQQSSADAASLSTIFDKQGSASFVATTPRKSYSGGFISIDAGVPFKLKDSSNFVLEPFLGIEGKIWNRSTNYGTEGNAFVVEEKYKFLSPSFGAKINYNTKSKVKLTLRISASYPILSKLKLDDKNLNLPNTELDLKKQFSPSIEIGARIKKLTIKLRYERINIGASDSLRGFSTPSSRANVSGVSIGYDF
jgi:hypothetical protein